MGSSADVCLVQCPLMVMTTIVMTMVIMVIVIFITMIISLVQCTLLWITLVCVVMDTCPLVHSYTTPSFCHFHPRASLTCVSFGGKCNFARLSNSGGCQLFEIGDCHSSSAHIRCSIIYSHTTTSWAAT